MELAILPLLLVAQHHRTSTGTHFPSHRGWEAEFAWGVERSFKSSMVRNIPSIFSPWLKYEIRTFSSDFWKSQGHSGRLWVGVRSRGPPGQWLLCSLLFSPATKRPFENQLRICPDLRRRGSGSP